MILSPVVKLVDDIPQSIARSSDKKRTRRGRRRQQHRQPNYISDDGSKSGSSADESSSSAPKRPNQRRRRQNHSKQSNEKSPRRRSRQNNDQEILSSEEQNKYVAMDCEMVGTGTNGYKSMVARVTMVGWNGNILLDEYVKPQEEVTDYRTFVSGIVASDLEQKATLTFEQCRDKVLDVLEGKTLVGHALKNDLRALNISHPWSLTRDTAKYEPFMQTRFDDGILWPRKLKDLAKQRLNRDIQDPSKPHSAYEDAVTAFDLYRAVRRKWEKAMEYKINKTKEIENSQKEKQ
jgi:RNA exonuclease 4